jgi:hypothetical protein
MLLYLIDRQGGKEYCWPGVRRIADDCNFGSLTSVNSARKELVEAGLIEVTPGGGFRGPKSERTSRYKVLFDEIEAEPLVERYRIGSVERTKKCNVEDVGSEGNATENGTLNVTENAASTYQKVEHNIPIEQTKLNTLRVSVAASPHAAAAPPALPAAPAATAEAKAAPPPAHARRQAKSPARAKRQTPKPGGSGSGFGFGEAAVLEILATYPKQSDHLESIEATKAAIKEIAKREGISERDATVWLDGRVLKFASSPAGKKEERWVTSCASWMQRGKYDDSDKSWGIRERSERSRSADGLEVSDRTRALVNAKIRRSVQSSAAPAVETAPAAAQA